MTILIGNINADKSELALYDHTFDNAKKRYVLQEMRKIWPCPMENYSGNNLPQIISDYLDEMQYNPTDDGDIYAVCLGISGPVENKLNSDNTTAYIDRPNFKAKFSIADLRSKLNNRYKGVPFILLNDMEAIGYAVLGEDQRQPKSLNRVPEAEIDKNSPKAVMLVSDGLGQIVFSLDQGNQILKPFPSEGGHSIFAPRNRDEIVFLQHLMNGQSSVSSEYVLSNKGLVRIYNFLVTENNSTNYPEPEVLRQLRDSLKIPTANIDPQPIIDYAFNQSNDFCLRAVEMFISIWGTKAGDIALTYKAKGGLYIGGISIPIVEKSKQDIFLESFRDKEGEFKNFNTNIPIYVYSPDRIVLQGAANYLTQSHYITSGKIIVKRQIDQGT